MPSDKPRTPPKIKSVYYLRDKTLRARGVPAVQRRAQRQGRGQRGGRGAAALTKTNIASSNELIWDNCCEPLIGNKFVSCNDELFENLQPPPPPPPRLPFRSSTRNDHLDSFGKTLNRMGWG